MSVFQDMSSEKLNLICDRLPPSKLKKCNFLEIHSDHYDEVLRGVNSYCIFNANGLNWYFLRRNDGTFAIIYEKNTFSYSWSIFNKRTEEKIKEMAYFI